MADKQQRPVLQAIAKIMGEVGAIEKRGENKFHNYKYATAADIAHALQKRMSAEGLVIVPNQREMTLLDNGAAMAIEFEFMVMHVSGDVLEERPKFTGIAGCRNTKGGFDDKAANKCLTAASKYFSLNLFRIPTGDYHDADAAEDAPQSPPQPRQQPKPAPQRSQATNGATRANGAPAASKPPVDWKQGDAIPFGDDGGQVSYVNTQGKAQPLDLADAIGRLEKAAEATTSLPDEEFAALLNANGDWLCNRAEAAMKALFGVRGMAPEDWLR